MRYFSNLNKIKETEGDIIEIKNFISKEEISKLANYANSSKNVFVNRDDGKKISFNEIKTSPVCNMDLWNELFKQILIPKLKEVFKDVNFYVDEDEYPPHIFKSLYPVKLHADSGKNNSDKIIYKQILIPLTMEPDKSEVYTVFFKNRWYGPAANFRSQFGKYDPLEIKDKNNKFIRIEDLQKFSDYLKKNKEGEIVFNSGLFDNTNFLREKITSLIPKSRYNITTSKFINKEKKFSEEIYNKYLTHENISDFYGMDFWKALKWETGTAIIWDRSIPHSSNNFLNSNVISKTGLSIFFNRK